MKLPFGIKLPFGKKTVAAVEEFALNELDKGIALAKTTPLGAAVSSAIHVAEAHGGSPIEKLATAVKIVAPQVIEYAARGGVKAVEADVEQFAKQLIESTLADLKQTKAVTIARAILAIFGK